MRTLLKSLLLALVITGAIGTATLAGTDPIDVKGSKEKNLLVFKAAKKLLGARIAVIHSNGDVVAEQTLSKRKMIIDFSGVSEGSYTIQITKGKQIETFAFDKK